MLFKIAPYNNSLEDYNATAEKILGGLPFDGRTVTILLLSYWLFVLRIGPKFMKDRPAFGLKYPMLLYNLYQALLNSWFTLTLLLTVGAVDALVINGCNYPVPWETNFYRLGMKMAYWFYISKVSDLLDTVFMILRKKNNHVTFLHVYHHSNMVLLTYFYCLYSREPMGLLAGWLNSSVHAVMYSYYFLAALGPHMQKYLWWKKYLTRFQMVQFVMIIVYFATHVLIGCKVSVNFAYILMFQGVTFFILFANFYVNTYITVKDSKGTETEQKDEILVKGEKSE